MIGSLYICSLRHNDNGVQNLSGLNDYLIHLLNPLYQTGNQLVYPAVYGDAIFTPLATIMRPSLSESKCPLFEKTSNTSSVKFSIFTKFYDVLVDTISFGMRTLFGSSSSIVCLYLIATLALMKAGIGNSIYVPRLWKGTCHWMKLSFQLLWLTAIVIQLTISNLLST